MTESYAVISLPTGMQMEFSLVARDDEIGQKFRRTVFDHPRFISFSQNFIRFLNKKGILDVLVLLAKQNSSNK